MKKKNKKSVVISIISVLLVLLMSLSATPVFGAEIGGSKKFDLSKYGEVITNEELGFLFSSSGKITKRELQEYIDNGYVIFDGTGNYKTLVPVGATVDNTTISFHYAQGVNGTIVPVRTGAGAIAGEPQLRLVANYNGENAYCIEPGKSLTVGDSLNKASDSWNGLSYSEQRAITVALCYGREGNVSAIKSGTTITNDEVYVATQIIVWEIVNGNRSSETPFNLLDGGLKYLFCSNGANKNVGLAYDRIIKSMQSYYDIPSFATRRYNTAPTLKVPVIYNENTQEYTPGSITINDANGTLKDFDFEGTYNVGNGTVKVTQDGNKITLKCTEYIPEGTAQKVVPSASKQNIPGKGTESSHAFVAYISEYAQDIVTGGWIDPPWAFFNIELETQTARDGKLQKVILTEQEWNNPDVDEAEGVMSTPENVSGWYFAVKASQPFLTTFSPYGFVGDFVDGEDIYLLLGPTDENGYTQSIGKYIAEKYPEAVGIDIPADTYQVYELGKLKDGRDGTDMDNDYYMPKHYLSSITNRKGTLRIEPSGSKTTVSTFSNTFKVPLELIKVNENGQSTSGFFFEATNKETGERIAFRTMSTAGQAFTLNSRYTDKFYNYIPEGTYTIKELGKLKDSSISVTSVTQDNYTSYEYEIPGCYDVPAEVEIEISASAYKKAQEAGQEAITVTFVNTTSSYISIDKSDRETGEKLAGAIYGVFLEKTTDENGNTIVKNISDTLVTDENGYAKSTKKYAVGMYYLQELEAPKGYKLDTTIYDVDVTPATEANAEIRVDVTDKAYKAKIKLIKVDEDTHEGLHGGEFLFCSDEACNDILETLVTDMNGEAQTANKYSPGTYYLKETKAPKGYVLDTTVHEIEVGQYEDENYVVSKTVSNKKKDYIIEIRKSCDLYSANVQNMYSCDKLAGAVYGIFSNKSCVGEPLEKVTIGDSNKATSEKRYVAGTYYIKELVAPEYHEISSEIVTLTITDSDNIETYLVNVSDVHYKTKVQIVKVDNDTNRPLEGAEFEFGWVTDKGVAQPIFNKFETLTTDENGIAVTAEYYNSSSAMKKQYAGSALTNGHYYLKETKAPNGYVIDDTIHSVTISEAETSNAVLKVEINNEKNKAYLQIKKFDSHNFNPNVPGGAGTPLAGATYGLYADKACNKLLESLPKTNSNGLATTSELYSTGTYYFKEISAPEGFKKSDEVIPVVIDSTTIENGATITKLASDDVNKWYIRIVKTDRENGALLKDSKWGLYDISINFNPNATPIEVITTDYQGTARTTSTYRPNVGYPGQTLFLKEISAPNGYVLDTTVYPVKLALSRVDGAEYLVELTNDPVKVNILIKKTDTVTYEGVGGATYGIYTSNTKGSDGMITATPYATATTKGNGVGEVSKELILGHTYYVQEITAPETHNLNKTIYTITVTEGTKVIEVSDSPKTGQVRLSKYTKFGTMSGVTFKLYRASDNKEIFVENRGGNLVVSPNGTISEFTTNNYGRIDIYGLMVGEYYFLETSTLEGYMPYADKLYFEMKLVNGKVPLVTVTATNNLTHLWDTGGIGNAPLIITSMLGVCLSAVLITLATKDTKKQKSKIGKDT